MTVAVTSTLDRGVRTLALDLAQRLADRFADEVRTTAPRATGEIADSVEVGGAVETGDEVHCSITVGAEHARYRDEGTGIYGPEGRRIEGNPLLAFDWPAAGGLVIVHSVAGSPGTHFWSNAVQNWPNIVSTI